MVIKQKKNNYFIKTINNDGMFSLFCCLFRVFIDTFLGHRAKWRHLSKIVCWLVVIENFPFSDKEKEPISEMIK